MSTSAAHRTPTPGPITGPGDLGRRVLARRAHEGLSRDDAASAAGMAPTYLRYLEESPRAAPSAAALVRLAGALGTSASALLGGPVPAPEPTGAATPGDRPHLEVLDEATSRALVATASVGRVVFTDARGPVALPVNLAVLGGDVVFETGDGSLRDAVATGQPISLEVDHLDAQDQVGWSVLLRGAATIDTPGGPAEPLVGSWAGAPRSTTVRLRADQVTGRRVHRDR